MFRPGDMVSLTSKLFPILNGDYVVSERFEPILGQALERTGDPDQGVCYSLIGLDGYWAEHSLCSA